MKPETILTNFNSPPDTRIRFDEICRLSGRTRTSVLVELMEEYVLLQGPALVMRNQELQQVDRNLGESCRLLGLRDWMNQGTDHSRSPRQPQGEQDSDPISPLWSDGREDW